MLHKYLDTNYNHEWHSLKIDFLYTRELKFNGNLNSLIYFTPDKKNPLILLWDPI